MGANITKRESLSITKRDKVCKKIPPELLQRQNHLYFEPFSRKSMGTFKASESLTSVSKSGSLVPDGSFLLFFSALAK